jgi:hypothetical protein
VSSIHIFSQVKSSFIAATTSSRSAINSASAFSSSANEPWSDGTQYDAVPFADDLEFTNAVKIQIAGQTDGVVIAVLKMDTVLISSS